MQQTTENKDAAREAGQINGSNIANESFYNLVQLQRITGYANPIAALRTTGETFGVIRDECGNIVSGQRVNRLVCNIHRLRGNERGFACSNREPLPFWALTKLNREGKGRKYIERTGETEEEAIAEFAELLGIAVECVIPHHVGF
jgi:hypothetical protein